MKLDKKAFALAGGILVALGIFIGTIIATYIGYGKELLGFMVIYPGYSVSITGAVIGGLWGFVDAGIGCWVFAWLYNKLAK
jgi:hypothetical protein